MVGSSFNFSWAASSADSFTVNFSSSTLSASFSVCNTQEGGQTTGIIQEGGQTTDNTQEGGQTTDNTQEGGQTTGIIQEGGQTTDNTQEGGQTWCASIVGRSNYRQHT